MWLPQKASWGVSHILYLQSASWDIVLTPVFYNTNNSSSLFFRFEYHSDTLSKWHWDESLEEWQEKVCYKYEFFKNDRSYWWKIDEDDKESIFEFLCQFNAIVDCFEAMGIKIKDCHERLDDLSSIYKKLKAKESEDRFKVIQQEKIIEKIVGVSRNDIITIYEMAAQCCSAYNNLIMLIDKKNMSKYVSYAKGTMKQSQYTQDIAEAKFWTDRIKAFTKPMADFCESMSDLYEQTQSIKSKTPDWDSEQPYGYATDFPLFTRAVENLKRLVEKTPDAIKKGEDAEYVEHCRKMANKQRIY